MLRGLRKASSNWLGRIVMGVVMTVLAGSFAIWGINDVFRGSSRTDVAKIGDIQIPSELFRQTYNDRIQQLSREIGHQITPDEARALGLDRQVLADMITESALNQLARQMRLGISDADIARRVMDDPRMQTPTGQFDPLKFQGYLRSVGYTEPRFIAEQHSLIPRRQITDAVSGGIPVPNAWVDAVNQFQNQERSVDYLELGPGQAGDIPQATAEELNKYFADRKILFRAPEYRKIETVAATPAELAKSIEVSDEDVKRAYEQSVSSYSTPERRQVEQIIFPNMAEAQAASERIKGGLSFAALAAERGLKDTDINLGLVPKSRIVDPAVANAVFSLKEGEVSAPVEGRFGAVIVTVLKIEPQETKSLEVVAPFIRNDIALQRARTQAQDIHDKIEDARAGGSTLEEAAKKLALAVVTYDAIDRSGRDPAGKLAVNLPGAGNVVSAAFATDVGVDNEPIEADGGYVWYELLGVTPAHDRTLDEVKSQVEQRWHDDEVASRLKAKAADLAEKLKNGTALDALAAANGLKVQTAKDLKRGAQAGVPAKMIEAVFHTAKDAFGTAQGDRPTQWIVFRVNDVKTPSLDPNSLDGKKLDQLLQRQMREDLFGQYISWLEVYLGLTVDQTALAQAVGNGSPDSN
jgi:peptidyl-prolyl cis-trans isomerase D